jgi:hypothetical protein
MNYVTQEWGGKKFASVLPTDMDIPDRAIQVGGAREGQSFVLKV